MAKGADILRLVCLIAYLAVFALRSLTLRLSSGVNPFKLGSGTRGWRKGMELLFVPFFLAWVVEALLVAALSPLRLFGPVSRLIVLDEPWTRPAGAVLAVVALALFVGALASFGDSWRVGIDDRERGELRTGGFFAFSRNPVFLSLDLLFAGTFLADGRLSLLIFAIIAGAGMHAQILEEERSLEASYGRAYLDYKKKTNRYLGRRMTADPKRKEADLGPIR
jgi:protein-S-isoprenylcysteine O-methyltransferase Ste14